MKTNALSIVFVSCIFLFLSFSCGQKQKPSDTDIQTATDTEKPEAEEPESDSKGKGPIGIRSGIIEYAYSGDKTGKSTQYFDDYGMKSAVYADIVTQSESSKGWAVTIGEDQYMWDPAKPGEGMKMKNPMVKAMMEKSPEEMEAFTGSMYEKMGMTKSGTEMFLGKECTVYKGDAGKVLIWRGILVLMEMKMGTFVSRQEATSIKTGIRVDDKYFQIPKNITFTEMPSMMDF